MPCSVIFQLDKTGDCERLTNKNWLLGLAVPSIADSGDAEELNISLRKAPALRTACTTKTECVLSQTFLNESLL